MLFNPTVYEKMEGIFRIEKNVCAFANATLCNDSIKDFLSGFCMRESNFQFEKTERMIFVIGRENQIDYSGYEYGIAVTSDGVTVAAENETGLIHGFMELLDMIEADLSGVYIRACTVKDKPKTPNIMIHICVFPETSLDFLVRTVRFCAFLKYTHIILEFWGMYKFDCLKELAWRNAYGKDDLKNILRETKEFGITLIPMTNHLGHASQSRMHGGKHTILDQNPALWRLFGSDGWAWNIDNPDTISLLSKMRKELCELMPDSKYFHIGCDEVYSYTSSVEKAKKMTEHINNTAYDLEKHGRRTIIWGDMLMYKHAFDGEENKYEFNIKNEEIANTILERIDKNIIIADWQYQANKVPVVSAVQFKNKGFQVLTCPFFESENISANAQTAIQNNLLGVICTTWHKIEGMFWRIAQNARECREGTSSIGNFGNLSCYYASQTASILRKVHFADGSYENSGWIKHQI